LLRISPVLLPERLLFTERPGAFPFYRGFTFGAPPKNILLGGFSPLSHIFNTIGEQERKPLFLAAISDYIAKSQKKIRNLKISLNLSVSWNISCFHTESSG
jgi:hypothetical protein